MPRRSSSTIAQAAVLEAIAELRAVIDGLAGTVVMRDDGRGRMIRMPSERREPQVLRLQARRGHRLHGGRG